MPVISSDGAFQERDADSGVFIVGKAGSANGAALTDLSGGVISLQYLPDSGLDPTVDANWASVSDTGSGVEILMEFNTAPQAVSFVFYGGPRRIRGFLTGAGTPDVVVNIESEIKGRVYR